MPTNLVHLFYGGSDKKKKKYNKSSNSDKKKKKYNKGGDYAKSNSTLNSEDALKRIPCNMKST